MNDIISDSRTKTGTSVGLIDSIIFIARVLAESDLNAYEIKEALKDLQADEDLRYLLELTLD